MSVYTDLVAAHGLSDSHRAVLDAVPRGARVLDVGCASGYLAEALERSRGCSVVGVERDAGAASAARARGLEVREADLEAEALDASGFDVVVFADVLEHLRDPARVLREAAAGAGLAVVSVPNVGHWTARRALLRGRWPQEDYGLFDRTHLRWFTRTSAHALAHEAGWQVAEERFTAAPLPLEAHASALGRFRAPLVRRFPELLALQVVLTLVQARSGP